MLVLDLLYNSTSGELFDWNYLTSSNFTHLNELSETTYAKGSIIGCIVEYSGIQSNKTGTPQLIGNIHLQLPRNTLFLLLSICSYGLSLVVGMIYAIIHYYIWRKRRDYRELNDAAVAVSDQVTLVENLEADYRHSSILKSFPVAQNAMWMKIELFDEAEAAELKDLQIKAIHGHNVKEFQERVYQLLKRKIKSGH